MYRSSACGDKLWLTSNGLRKQLTPDDEKNAGMKKEKKDKKEKKEKKEKKDKKRAKDYTFTFGLPGLRFVPRPRSGQAFDGFPPRCCPSAWRCLVAVHRISVIASP